MNKKEEISTEELIKYLLFKRLRLYNSSRDIFANTERMTYLEAIIAEMVYRAIDGDVNAAKLILDLMKDKKGEFINDDIY